MTIWTAPLLSIYCIVASISLIGSIFVAISIYKFGAKTLTTKLVLYLHISQIIQDVMALPYVFNGQSVICSIAGWLHIYSGMSNIMCVAIMIIAYRHMFFEDKHKISAFCSKYCAALVFGFPLVSALPLITNSYGRIHNELCSFNGESGLVDNLWQGGFYIWSIVIFLCCVVVMYVTVAEVYRADKELAGKLMKSIVLYSFATLIFWIPRCVFQAIGESNYNIVISAYFLIFAAGIVYSLIFYQEKSAMKLFEQNSSAQSNMNRNSVDSVHNDGDEGSFTFSFDEGGPFDLSMSRNSTSSRSNSMSGGKGNLFRESAILSLRSNPIKPVVNVGSTSTENPVLQSASNMSL